VSGQRPEIVTDRGQRLVTGALHACGKEEEWHLALRKVSAVQWNRHF
jgi:hypothetical protein